LHSKTRQLNQFVLQLDFAKQLTKSGRGLIEKYAVIRYLIITSFQE